MEISRTTRTHVAYQFIIIALLVFGIGFQEFLSGCRALFYVIILCMLCYHSATFIPYNYVFSVICWTHNVFDYISGDKTLHSENASDAITNTSKEIKEIKTTSSPEKDGSIMKEFKIWDQDNKAAGESLKLPTYSKRSKSWVNLRESSPLTDKSKEGSLEALSSLPERKLRNPFALKSDKLQYFKERTNKAKSWKMGITNPNFTQDSILEKSANVEELKENVVTEQNIKSCSDALEESELSKSYSFPFRQKRLETWIEMKETEIGESNQSLNMPYWQTVGYNLAVKYEARRRRRAVSSPTEEIRNEPDLNKMEHTNETQDEQLNQKKIAKISLGCINKIKSSLFNLMAKNRKDLQRSVSLNSKSSAKTFAFPKLKSTPPSRIKLEESKKSSYPRFLSNDRPLIFYPKYLPFEKQRFESDVQKKMIELGDE